jgi:hypothetical protein
VILLACAALFAAQADTAVTVRGLLGAVVDRTHAPTWVLALPAPVRFRDRIIGEVELSGNQRLWGGFDRGFVEVSGTLRIDGPSRPALNPTKVREVLPEGLVRREVSTSFSQRTVASVFVLPRTIRWRDVAGQPTGVGPVLVYSLNNHGQATLTLDFRSEEYVCFKVRRKGGEQWIWEDAIRFDKRPTEDYKLTVPVFVREWLPLTETAAPTPGRYQARAGLCGFGEYQVEAEFDVVG